MLIVDGHKVGDYTGFRSGKLIAASVAEYRPRGRTRWLCKCDCGNFKILEIAELRRTTQPVRSCGCSINVTHGKHNWPEYSIWRGMIYRCHSSTAPKFKDYGGRGIYVCDRWRFGDGDKTAFDCFIEDVGRRPSPDLSLDREDNNGNYEPGNCRWATVQQQNQNRRGTLKQTGT